MSQIVLRIINRLCGSVACQQRVTQPAFLITAVSVIYLGETSVLPLLYTNWGYPNLVPVLQWTGYVIALQLFTNWLCVKFVPSNYDPLIHGAEKTNYSNHFPSKSVPFHSNNDDVEDNSPKRIVTSYFAWSYCIRCDKPRPPRCHHCPICQTCILKRDHHCFLTGVCIGYNNLRHFVVFLFWTVICTIFSLCHMIPYYVMYILPTVPLLTTNPISRTYTVADIQTDMQWIFLTLLFASLIFFTCWSLYFFRMMTNLLQTGKTTFEDAAQLNLYDNRDLTAKLKSVFGEYWIVNFVMPLHFVYEPQDDPVYWPNIK